MTGRGLAHGFQEKEGLVEEGGGEVVTASTLAAERDELPQVWACHLFLNAGRWWAWRSRRPLSLPRCASVMDAASGSAAEEAEAHLREPITGWGAASTSGLFVIPSHLLALVFFSLSQVWRTRFKGWTTFEDASF